MMHRRALHPFRRCVMAKQIARHPQSYTAPLPLPPTQRFLPLLLLLFVGSGCAALIYEIVWFQLIELVIGSSASRSACCSARSWAACVWAVCCCRGSYRRSSIRCASTRLLEAGIGVLGLSCSSSVPLVGGAYTATSAHGFVGILLRGLVCAVCLLPPTLLMGATLPAIARWVETTPTGVSWLGFFYGSNIAGAVFGCLLAGFYLLRVHDMTTTTIVAVASTSAWPRSASLLSKRAPHRPAVQARTATGRSRAPPCRARTRCMWRSRSRVSRRSAPRSCGRGRCR